MRYAEKKRIYGHMENVDSKMMLLIHVVIHIAHTAYDH